MPERRREQGAVRWFKAEKGYGRIASDEFEDLLFVHFSSIVQPAGGFRQLREGDRVEYTRLIQPGPAGPRAVAIDVVLLTGRE